MNVLLKNIEKYKRKIMFVLAFLCVFQSLFLFSSSVFAISLDDDPCEGKSCLQVGIADEKLPEEMQQKDGEGITEKIISVINYLLSFVGLVLIIIVIYAGVILIFSLGDDDKLDEAKKMIINALIGVIIIILSYSIVYFIGNILSSSDSNNSDVVIGSNGNDGVNGQNGNGGNNGNDANIEKFDAEIKALQDQIKVLSEKDDTESMKKIEELSAKIDAIVSEKNTKELENKIKGLEEEIALRNKNTSPGSEEEMRQLEKELSDLKDALESSIFDTNEALAEITRTIDGANEEGQVLDTNAIEKYLNILEKNSNGNKELEEKYNTLKALVNKLVANPQNNSVIDNLKKEVEDVQKIVENLFEIKPRILLQSSQSESPASITLSGEKTIVDGNANIILQNDNFHWSVIGPDGVKQVLGNGINYNFIARESGRYIFILSVDNSDTSVVSGFARKAFTVNPPDTKARFMVGQKTMNETIEFTADQNTEGIIFNPSLTTSKAGRNIESYIWNFNGYKLEEKEGKPVLYSFSKNGEYSVSLEVIDNLGVHTVSKTVKVFIKPIVAYFTLEKEKFENGEVITFSGDKSYSDSGIIQDYNWKILKETGEVVTEIQSKSFEYAFEEPGDYIVKLVVTDANGKISSFAQNLEISALPPKAKFTIEKIDISRPALRVFNANKSIDFPGSELVYSWDFDGDGVFEKTDNNNPEITHEYEKIGSYDAVLRVQNKFGEFSDFTKNVDITSLLSAQIETESIVYKNGEEVKFEAVSSGGSVFQWKFGDGSHEVITDEKNITHIFEKAGRYTVSLRVNNEDGDSTFVRKTIFIGDVESPTSAISVFLDGKKTELEENLCGSGKDGIEITRAQKLELSAENSVNINGSSAGLSYVWKFSNKERMDKKQFLWKFEDVSVSGVCEKVSLNVIDTHSKKESLSDTVYFFVKNDMPEIVNFTAKIPSEILSPLSVQLSLSANDPDGKIMRYSWWAERKGDELGEKIGFHATQVPSTVLTLGPFGEEGDIHEYVLYGKVIDDSDAEATTKDNFGLLAPVFVKTDKNRAPSVALTANKDTILLGDTVSFTASVLTQEGIDISSFAEYKWDFDNDNVFDEVTTQNTVSHEYIVPGEKSVRVKVLYQGLVTSDVFNLNVQKILQLPRAKFSVVKSGVSPEEVSLSGKASLYDKSLSGNALQYEWDIDIDVDSDKDGDATNDKDYTSSTVTHTYKRGQTQSAVKLTVTNASGVSDSFIQLVNINELSGVLPLDTKEYAIGDALVPENVTDNINETSEKISVLLSDGETVSEKELYVFDEVVESLSENISESDYLYADLKALQELQKNIKKDPEDKNSLLKFKSALDDIVEKSNNYALSKWKPVEFFKDKINKSLEIVSSAVGTHLDIYGGEGVLQQEETIDIFAFIKNADGSLYSGPVRGSVVEGSGTLLLETVQAVEGHAVLEFTPTELGIVVLEITAEETVSGVLSERLLFIIHE